MEAAPRPHSLGREAICWHFKDDGSILPTTTGLSSISLRMSNRSLPRLTSNMSPYSVRCRNSASGHHSGS